MRTNARIKDIEIVVVRAIATAIGKNKGSINGTRKCNRNRTIVLALVIAKG